MVTIGQVKAEYPNRRVVNSKKRKQVIVMAKDIKGAVRSDPRNCPFARACTRQEPDVQEVIINKSTAYIVYPNRIERYRVVTSMSSEIVSFDRSGIFAEGTYNLGPALAPRERPAGKIAGPKKGRKPAALHASRHRTIMVRGA